MGTQLPLPKKGGTAPPQFSAHIYCGQTAGCIRIPLGTEVGLILGNIVFDGDPVPHHLKGHSPQFSAHVRCGQTAGVTMMSLGMEVGLGPGDFVLDGDPAPPQKGGRAPSPIFSPFLLWTNGWMHQDATWYGGRPWPRLLCVKWGPRSPSPKGG